MPLKVLSCCTYLTADNVPWRGLDYDAHDFVHAVKAHPFEGYVQLMSRGRTYRISSTNCDIALTIFGHMVADAGITHGFTGPLALVPVPNSKNDVASLSSRSAGAAPRTRAQAEALVHELSGGASVADVLRWSEPLPSASSGGGSRDPQELYEKLRVVGALPDQHARIVLVDDVLTSGGHLQACAAMLRHRGADVVLAVVAGRSDRAQVEQPFAVRVDELADFVPRRRRVGL